MKTLPPHLFALDDGFLIPVPYDLGDFYISGTGHLCSRTPFRGKVLDNPLTPYGVYSTEQIVGYASAEEKQRAGLDVAVPALRIRL